MSSRYQNRNYVPLKMQREPSTPALKETAVLVYARARLCNVNNKCYFRETCVAKAGFLQNKTRACWVSGLGVFFFFFFALSCEAAVRRKKVTGRKKARRRKKGQVSCILQRWTFVRVRPCVRCAVSSLRALPPFFFPSLP